MAEPVVKKINDPEEVLKKITDPDKVLGIMKNAKRLKNKGHYELCFSHYCDLKAAEHETDSFIVRGYYRFLYAYEQALTEKNGKRTNAGFLKKAVTNRIEQNGGDAEKGIVAALTELVTKKGASSGYQFLMYSGQSELTAEHLVKENPQRFSKEAVTAATEKLNSWEPSMADSKMRSLIDGWE